MLLTPGRDHLVLAASQGLDVPLDLRVAVGQGVTGGVALNELLGGRRRSRDVDLFHDTAEALLATWQADEQPPPCLRLRGR